MRFVVEGVRDVCQGGLCEVDGCAMLAMWLCVGCIVGWHVGVGCGGLRVELWLAVVAREGAFGACDCGRVGANWLV